MLDDLDKVKWDQLSHAYGKATDVPDLLRALASDQKEVWDKAISQLFCNIWHQGTVYEATAYAIPFLIELLEAPTVVCKSWILYLLRSLATGNSYLNAHQNLDWYRNERKTEEFQSSRRRELDDVRAAHDAVVEGTPVYLSLLSHPEAAVRSKAFYVLSVCPERAQEIEPVFRERFSADVDPEVKASMLMALAQLWRRTRRLQAIGPATPAEQHTYFANIFRSASEPPVVRFVAALSAVEFGGEEAVEEALPVFHETIDARRGAFSRLSGIEDGSPLGAVSKALFPYPHLRLQWLLEMLAHPNPELRKDAVWEVRVMCRQRRSTPPVVVPHLVKLVADPDPEVRGRAAAALPALGQARRLATDDLNSFLSHSIPEVRVLAAKTLEKVQENRDKYELKKWLRKPKVDKDVAEWIAIIEEKRNSRRQDDQRACSDVAAALEFMAPVARDAVPALRKLLNHEYQWARVHAARALWRITQDTNEALPVLLEELRCRPAGLLVADCLGEMGRLAPAAMPALRRIIDSEVRLVESGALEDWVDEDEAFCEAAKRALARIEADLAEPQ